MELEEESVDQSIPMNDGASAQSEQNGEGLANAKPELNGDDGKHRDNKKNEPAPEPISFLNVKESDLKGFLGIYGNDNKASFAEGSYNRNTNDSNNTNNSNNKNSNNTTTNYHQHYYGFSGDQQQQEDSREDAGSEKSLYEITKKLPQKRPCAASFQFDDLDHYLNKLRQEHLLMISCFHEDIAFDVGRELISRLGFADESNRMLDLGSGGEETSDLMIFSLLNKTTEADKETAILIDAFRDKTEAFLDSLFYGASQSDQINEDLQEAESFLVCITEPTEVWNKANQNNRELRFPHWEIPFLRPLLKSRFDQYAELEQQIQDQRLRGHWSHGEDDFYKEIRKFLNKGDLLNRVKSIEANAESTPASSLFKGNDPVSDTVLFTAAYFPDLSLVDFKQVVAALLDDRTITVSAKAFKQGDDGALEPHNIQKETPLAQIWRDDADKILKLCRLEIASGTDSIKVVDFSDPATKERIEAHLESEHGFYLEKQLEAVQNQGFIFHRSANVNEKAIRFIVARAASSPEDYDKSWIIDAISKFELHYAFGEYPKDDSEATVFQFLKELYRNRSGWVYARISALLRTMLQHPKLINKVKEILEQLMIRGLHRAVLQITMRLRFAQGFDKFYWMKQLFDRGDLEIREKTYRYLVLYLESLDVEVYERLSVLKSWLPEQDCGSLSKSGRNALSSVLEYCIETTRKFDAKYYGLWPSRFPLFAVKDENAFERDAEVLAKWLFHPCMKNVLNVEPGRLVGLLIAEWSFILRGPAEKSGGARKANDRKADKRIAPRDQRLNDLNFGLDAAAMLQLLLKKVAAAASASQQKALIRSWQQMIQHLFDWIDSLPPSDNLRKELIWQRNQTRVLIREFKEVMRRTKPPTAKGDGLN